MDGGPTLRYHSAMLKDDTRIRLCRAREMLAAVDDHAVRVDDVAREVRMSPFHFIRQFGSVFGVTPHQFRIERRLEQARILLARGDHSVTDVCMEVGFSSLGSFSALFARRVGESPSAYQRRIRVKVSVPGCFQALLFPGCFSLLGELPPGAFSSFREA
jgi:AraC-like DNA-binding protein